MCVWRAQETNNRTFCQSSKCFSIAVSQESAVPSAIFNDFSELLGEGWKVRSVASVQLCRRMLATPSRRPFLHSATHDFSFRLILYQLEEEKALPPKVAYYGILYRIFPLSRAAAANPARGPSFPPLLAFREDVGVLSVYQTYKKARQGDCAKTKNGESVMKNGCG